MVNGSPYSAGVYLRPRAGLTGVIRNTKVTFPRGALARRGYGILFEATNAPAGSSLGLSVFDSSASDFAMGFAAFSNTPGGPGAVMALDNLTSAGNQTGVYAGVGAQVSVARSNVSRNDTGFSINSPSVLYTLGDNNLTFNYPDVSGSLTPYAPK